MFIVMLIRMGNGVWGYMYEKIRMFIVLLIKIGEGLWGKNWK